MFCGWAGTEPGFCTQVLCTKVPTNREPKLVFCTRNFFRIDESQGFRCHTDVIDTYVNIQSIARVLHSVEVTDIKH